MITKFDLGSFYIELNEQDFLRLKPGKHKGKSSIIHSEIVHYVSENNLEKKCHLNTEKIDEEADVSYFPEGTTMNSFDTLQVRISHKSYDELEKKGRIYLPYVFGLELEIKRIEFCKP